MSLTLDPCLLRATQTFALWKAFFFLELGTHPSTSGTRERMSLALSSGDLDPLSLSASGTAMAMITTTRTTAPTPIAISVVLFIFASKIHVICNHPKEVSFSTKVLVSVSEIWHFYLWGLRRFNCDKNHQETQGRNFGTSTSVYRWIPLNSNTLTPNSHLIQINANERKIFPSLLYKKACLIPTCFVQIPA